MVAAWSVERRQQAVDLYESGKTLVEIAAIMKAGSLVIQKYLRQAGVKRRPAAPRGWSRERIDLCLRLYEEGKTQSQIAEAVGSGQGHVGGMLRRLGVELRRHWSVKRRMELVSLYRSGLSASECARRLGTNTHTVRHYLRRLKVPLRSHQECTPQGEGHWNWKGGRAVHDDGYIYLRSPDHPHKTSTGYVLEHRLVMEASIGRFLRPEEVVHHRNKDKHDNRLDNLQLFATNGEHLAFELKGQCPEWSEEGKARVDEVCRRNAERRRKTPRPTPGGPPSPSASAPTGT